jgi:hypothetical protein
MRKNKLLSVRISDVTRLVKKLKTKEIFLHYETFDSLISQILQMFENNDFCRKYRLHQNFIYMLFLDLVKIYNVFYILTMETLDRYRKMSAEEMQKSLILYQNFCNFTESLRKQANTIPMMFGFTFKEPSYYKPDANKERAMKNALKDKEAGGGDFEDDEDFGDEMPEFNEPEFKPEFNDEEKDNDEEDSDEDYNFDLLGDIKKQEQMASVHGAKRSKTMKGGPTKIKVDEFNTAALDDLLGNQEVQRHNRAETMHAPANNDEEEEWDPFGGKQENVYSTQQPAQAQAQAQAPLNDKPTNGSGNIFGDDDDMWGGGNQTSTIPQTKMEQKQTLDDILGGGDDDYSAQQRSQSMAVPNTNYDMLKNLYNTAANPPQQMNMGGGLGGQQDYFNTGMPNSYGMNNMGGGYNQGYNTGYNQSYGAGYNQNYGGGVGYNQYNTSMGGGYGYSGNQGYTNYGGEYNQPTQSDFGFGGTTQNKGFSTAAPSGQTNKNNDFDPFS